MSSADRINIDPVVNVRKVTGANPFMERNASKRKDNKNKSEKQKQDEQLEEDIGSDGEFHVIDYKA